jgi:hypothetical protein
MMPWQLFEDATIVRLERDLGDTVRVWIDAPRLRSQFGDGGTLFVLRLARCELFRYTPLDEPPLDDLAAIAASEPTILAAEPADDGVVIRGSAGTITTRYASFAIELDTGRALTVDELVRAQPRGP